MTLYLLFVLSLSSVEAAPPDRNAYENGDWESMRAQLLVQPRADHDMAEQLARLDRAKALRTLCDVQLKTSKLPVSCFELLDVEKNLRILSKSQWAENLKRIDETCVSVARKLSDFKDVQFELQIPQSKCRDVVQDRREKLKYGSTLRRPAEVFSTRHRF